jgi:hydroxymethylpyrimidine pyrophosphatase-like HAD family hydrolase
MKEIRIAFDIDGTIWGDSEVRGPHPSVVGNKLNLPIVHLMDLLSRYTKNVKIIVWSGGGADYAETVVRKFGLESYVDEYHGKVEYDEERFGKIDIAFDDIHSFEMADKNIIVRMKK